MFLMSMTQHPSFTDKVDGSPPDFISLHGTVIPGNLSGILSMEMNVLIGLESVARSFVLYVSTSRFVG